MIFVTWQGEIKPVRKYSAAYEGEIKSFGTPFSLILRSKISENGVPKIIVLKGAVRKS